MPRRENYHNQPGEPTSRPLTTRDEVRVEFSKRLSEQLTARGWNQSDLARAAAKFMPAGKEFGRDKVSHYIRGRAMPTPASLHAMAQALGVEPVSLLPEGAVPSSTSRVLPKLEIRDMDDGTVWLKINRAVSKAAAIKIQQVIMEDDANI